ncbi:MAG: hypothetical protein M1827_002920 [Pycnora praestabilis]|nr:MAG: hypothetical protein M1827_002920 [Pycnora praestabilis]
MSSRALRKAQREREEQRLAEELGNNASDGDELNVAPIQPQPSSFAMLNEANGEEDGGKEESSGTEDEDKNSSTTQPESKLPLSASKPKKKTKKKSKKKATATKPSFENQNKSFDDKGMDEIDLALRTLSTNAVTNEGNPSIATNINPDLQELCRLLSIDLQHLNVSNEMRRLFGRAASEGYSEDGEAAGAGRRRGRGQQQMGLAGVVAGQNLPGGRGLAGLGLRRNIFIQGKEEWPRATAGGLGMEIVEKGTGGITQYKFVHNGTYQDVQRQFSTCVESMDPNRMVQLLQYNPYHISTLLQVSEIAKQERDHTTSGDLLERALFSFGRSVHSTFSANLAQGKARFDFRRPENREFWLASWRYINNLGMRGTWRTAYEWVKLVLSLDPEGDPYCMHLLIDQIALRARQAQNFLDLTKTQFYIARDRSTCPNLRISVALAEYRLGLLQDCRRSLSSAVVSFPWLFARMFQELNIDRVPPSVWGKNPKTPVDTLHSELYVQRARDLWNTPEATSLLVEVADAVSLTQSEAIQIRPISLNEARHVTLTDIPALIALLPRELTTRGTSSSDPMPPLETLRSYNVSDLPSPDRRRNLGTTVQNAQELNTLTAFFQSIFPWFNGTAGVEGGGDAPHTEDEVERAIVNAGVDANTIISRLQRMQELRQLATHVEEYNESALLPPELPTEQDAATVEEALNATRRLIDAHGEDEETWGEEVDVAPLHILQAHLLTLDPGGRELWLNMTEVRMGQDVRYLIENFMEAHGGL